jgi:hypothetical protein
MELKQGQLDLFTEDTLANLLVLPGSERARQMTAISGQRLSAYYKNYSPVGLLAKMLLGTSHWGSTKCLMIWEASITPRKRLLFQLVVLEQIIDESGYSLLPTPIKSSANGAPKNRYLGSKTYKSNFNEAIRNGVEDGTYPDPEYVEQVMGFPITWTELEP